jgi:hypothetical protein
MAEIVAEVGLARREVHGHDPFIGSRLIVGMDPRRLT